VEPYLGTGELARAREAAKEAVEAGRLSRRAHALSRALWARGASAHHARGGEVLGALWTRAYAESHAGDVHDAVRLAAEAVEAARGLEANVLAGADPGWTLRQALLEAGGGRGRGAR